MHNLIKSGCLDNKLVHIFALCEDSYDANTVRRYVNICLPNLFYRFQASSGHLGKKNICGHTVRRKCMHYVTLNLLLSEAETSKQQKTVRQIAAASLQA